MFCIAGPLVVDGRVMTARASLQALSCTRHFSEETYVNPMMDTVWARSKFVPLKEGDYRPACDPFKENRCVCLRMYPPFFILGSTYFVHTRRSDSVYVSF